MGLVSIGIGGIFSSLFGSFLSDSVGVFEGDLGSRISAGNRAENRELHKPDNTERIKKGWENLEYNRNRNRNVM